jgi:type II secretory pathway pseudopilin PulG
VSTIDVVLLAIAVAAVLVVFVGSRIARRRAAARDEQLRARLAAANDALAHAHAADKGWDRALLEAACREVVGPADELRLVQVIDRPGTDEDEAVFEAVRDGQPRQVMLKRTGDTWVAR